MYDDVTFKIVNVGDKRINRLDDRFVGYLLADGKERAICRSRGWKRYENYR
jgi:hypothetical protein